MRVTAHDRMRRSRHSGTPIAFGIAAICVAACGRATAPDPIVSRPTGTTSCSSVNAVFCSAKGAAPGANVLDAAMIDPTSGWALTINGLSIIQNGRTTWRPIEPPGVTSTTILAVQFLSADDGWVVSSADGMRVTIDRTSDGGATWTSVRLPVAAGDRLIQSAYADFAGSDGWLVVGRGASQSPETGTLYVTTNSGGSFHAVPIPAAAPVRFLNQEDGFTVGGAPHSGVYATRNGGITWQAVALPQVGGPSAVVDVDNMDQNHGASDLLAVNLRTNASGLDGLSSSNGVAVYSWTSAAGSFALNGNVAFASPSTGTLALSIPNSDDVIAVAYQADPPGVATYTSTDAGRHFARETTLAHVGLAAFPNATQVASASFVNARLGWAIGVYTACFSGGMVGQADCHSSQLLFATANGGATWAALSPP